MPSLALDLVQELHETNRRVRLWLESLSSASTEAGVQPCPATPEQMNGLLAELMRAGTWLRELPENRNAALAQEVAEYRKQIEQLRGLLLSIHDALLRERARLEQERNRLASAGQWARGSRQTL